MKILSLETATYFGGVALVTPWARLSAGPFSSRGASREILTAADKLLRSENLEPNDLDAVAVSTGPGLFTGVRVGLSIAKTWTWTPANNTERSPALVEVPTLEAVAAMALDTGGLGPGDLVAAITDARRGELYAALFEMDGELDNDLWPRALGPSEGGLVVRPERLEERLFPSELSPRTRQCPVVLIGDGVDRYRETILEGFGARARVAPYEGISLPLKVADLGLRRLRAGQTTPSEEASPRYVRRPDARRPAGISFLSGAAAGEAAHDRKS